MIIVIRSPLRIKIGIHVSFLKVGRIFLLDPVILLTKKMILELFQSIKRRALYSPFWLWRSQITYEHCFWGIFVGLLYFFSVVRGG